MASTGVLGRLLGQRYIELAKNWAPTAAVFGATATVAGLYFTDWQVFVRYIPYYGSKFAEPVEAKK